ncbi:MAG: glycosyltransferase family 2 protein [Calditrichaeota bacterium]|nr:glycosyltransferase family 2 protein [Calditrichota bacterium]
MTPNVLIIIPAYNEERTIAGILQQLRDAAPDYHRLVINDGSQDGTAAVVEALGEKQLRFPFNLGYGLALQAGLKYALSRGYGIVVSIDADGQHDPRDVPRLVQALQESDAGMVIGSRFCEGRRYHGPLDRRIGQQLFSILTRPLIGRRIYDTTSGFKALTAPACAAVVDGVFMDFHIETIVRLSLIGQRIIELPLIVAERSAGVSMHSFISIFKYPLKTLLLTVAAIADALLTRRRK